jgi:prophage antirepressor-like protein
MTKTNNKAVQPWVTDSLLKSIKKKNYLYRKSLKGDDMSRAEYSNYKNALTAVLKKAKIN